MSGAKLHPLQVRLSPFWNQVHGQPHLPELGPSYPQYVGVSVLNRPLLPATILAKTVFEWSRAPQALSVPPGAIDAQAQEDPDPRLQVLL